MAVSLPIDDVLPDLLLALRNASSAVLQAPPGAGKTSRVPTALLADGFAKPGQIVVLEPRRLAARTAALRMSFEQGTPPGGLIGWQVRFDRKSSRDTQILCVTPGIFLRMLQDDPYLERVACVILDEFHERGLETDLALSMVRLIQQNVRPELKLLVMSATLETASIARYLGDCPVITSEGKTFPVDVRYEAKREGDRWPNFTARAIERALSDTAGSILVFLPGVGEIRATADELLGRDDILVLPLHGELPPEEQDRALRPQRLRKVVLATNVAETSVTVEDVTVVIDTGLARQRNYDQAVGLDRLELVNISRASADQRAGRAGRTQPGTCVRLWSEVSHRSRVPFSEPEVRRVDLAGPALQLLAWREDIFQFPWLDAPDEKVLAQAVELLERLGAIADGELTSLGQTLAQLPIQPRLGRLLLEGAHLGQPRLAALTAAMLAERDPFPRGDAPHATPSDVVDRIDALQAFENNAREQSPLGSVNRGTARTIFNARDQLARLVADTRSTGSFSPEEAIGRALLAAFPDRLCRRREVGSRRGVMVGGRGVRLAPSSGVESELFVGIDLDAGQSETLVRQASAIEREWLTKSLLQTSIDVDWDDASGRVIAARRTRYLDLVIEETTVQNTDRERSTEVLIAAATRHLDRVLPEAESAAGRYRLRIQSLSQWMPELELPSFDEALALELLHWLVPGCRSLEEVRQADWEAAYRNRLTHSQRQAVDREAPERIEVPSGSLIALQYELGRPPILPVRVQELFGLTETPTIAGGRVKVLLHLLAPNYRPQQVTDDLASFWANTYPIVRKELRSRYPKHSWPDNPLVAEPLSRPKRRGT